jgi:hypothetical protein
LANGRRRIATSKGIQDPVLVAPFVNDVWDFSAGVSNFVCISARLIFSI